MAVEQPQATDPLNSPSHSNLHRIIAADLSADAQTIAVQSDSSTRIGDGDGSNYTKFEADGTVVFEGDAVVWDDVNAIFPSTGSNTEEFKDSAGNDTGIVSWSMQNGEKMHGVLEIPHNYKEGTNLSFHVHFQNEGSIAGATDNVKFELTYMFMGAGDTANDTTINTGDKEISTDYAFDIVEFSDITGTNVDMGDQFVFMLERVAASADDYAGKLLMATVGIHYEIDTVGSRQKLSK